MKLPPDVILRSLMKQFAGGRDAERPLQPVLPESDGPKEVTEMGPKKIWARQLK